jgi:hypothetical protein
MVFSQDILIYISLGLSIILLCWNIFLQTKMKKLIAGKNSQTLDDSINFLNTEIKTLNKFRSDTLLYLTDAEKRLKRSVQAVETIRFNPFKGTGAGGNQSFATAFLNENGDGVVLSSLYSRERVSIFSKAIEKMQAGFELSEEEKEALTKAKEKIS